MQRLGYELEISAEISVILSHTLLFSCRFLCNQRDKLPIRRFVPLIEEIHAQELIGGIESPAIPGDFDGISCDGPETALKRVFSGVSDSARRKTSKQTSEKSMPTGPFRGGPTNFRFLRLSTSGLYTLSVSKISDFAIPVPPIELQNQFAALVEQTDKSKLAIQNGLERLELMKKALMQKYFG